jgi:DNA helicase-2/ATP-dependent DNA helicase PcrA
MADIELTSSQREAVEHGDGPMLIVAGAGTGKTMVITRRVAHLITSKLARPEEVLALTFTEKAAAEMSERVDVLLPYGYASIPISTFHAFGDRILREFALELGLHPDFQVLSQPEQVIFFREHLFEFPLRHYRPLGDPTKFIQAMLGLISRAKDEDVSPEAYLRHVRSLKEAGLNAEFREEIEKQEETAETYALYQELLAREGRVDFGDQVVAVLRLFRERPSVLKAVRRRHRYILVDEFQDTNFAQFQLIRLLGGDSANVTVVGDDDQSIYKFRGAAVSNILNFMDVYPQARQVVLSENFRSTQVILDTSYRLILHNNPDRLEVKNRIDKRLVSKKREGEPVQHFHCDTLTTESDRVAQTIFDLVADKGIRHGDVAILVRSNNDADPFLRALNMKGIPWRFTGNRGLYSRPEVRLLVAFLRTVADFNDSLSLYHLASSGIYELSLEALHHCVHLAHKQNRSLFDILSRAGELEELAEISAESKATMAKIVDDLRRYLELSRSQITGQVLYQFLMGSGYLNRLTRDTGTSDTAKVQNIARFFDVIWAASQVIREDRVLHFVRYLDLLIEAGDDPAVVEADPDDDAVNVMTVHKAKGLEWPVVFMVSLIQNKFPHTRRSDPIGLPDALVSEPPPAGDAHMQEERRLFYVGMTRAKDRLFLTSAQDYGGVRSRKASPFILEALDRPHADVVTVKSPAEERIRRFAPTPDATPDAFAAIPEDKVLNLSHFQIDDYLTCPLKYKYVHILRVPILPHHSVIYGKALHTAIEYYHAQKINAAPVRIEDVVRVYEGAWKNAGFISREHEERRFEGGKEALERFFEREEASGAVPALVEERFSFVLKSNRIEGRWDRVDRRPEGVVIVDFKSSDVYQQDAADKRAKDSLQLAIYALAYQKTFGGPPVFMELRFLESGLIGKAEATSKKLLNTENSILEAAGGIRKRAYPAMPDYMNCRFCAYAEICPSVVRG